jgi:hypothetical protein
MMLQEIGLLLAKLVKAKESWSTPSGDHVGYHTENYCPLAEAGFQSSASPRDATAAIRSRVREIKPQAGKSSQSSIDKSMKKLEISQSDIRHFLSRHVSSKSNDLWRDIVAIGIQKLIYCNFN